MEISRSPVVATLSSASGKPTFRQSREVKWYEIVSECAYFGKALDNYNR